MSSTSQCPRTLATPTGSYTTHPFSASKTTIKIMITILNDSDDDGDDNNDDDNDARNMKNDGED